MQSLEAPEVATSLEISWDHLRPDLIARLRRHFLAKGDHAGDDLSDKALLVNTHLAYKDPESGEAWPTLAALLLLGSDEAIRTMLPHHGTLAVRKVAKGRGDREDIRTNLLETHDRLVAFAARHLPEHTEDASAEDTIRVRDGVMGEIFANSLIFRDYSKIYPARFLIEPSRITLEYGQSLEKGDNLLAPLAGLLLPLLGQTSAKSYVTEWAKAYFGLAPLIFQGSIFRFLAPFPKQDLSPVRPIEDPVDLTEAFATQAPWTTSTAAQNEVAQTGSAIEDLSQIPIPTDIIKHGSMQVETTMEVFTAPETVQASISEKSVEPITPLRPSEVLDTSAMQVAKPVATLQASASVQEIKTPAEPTPSMQPDTLSMQPEMERVARERISLNSKTPVYIPNFMDLKPSMQGKLKSVTEPAPRVKAYPSSAPQHPVTPADTDSAASKNHAAVQAERAARILEFCRIPRDRSDIQAHVGINNRDYFRKDILLPLIESGRLAPTLPDKPNSPKQQYQTVS